MDDLSETRRFKKLTPLNWRQLDRTVGHIVRVSEERVHQISGDEWATQLLQPQLSKQVPEDVRQLFEVAQGVLCFGCFYYPLYTLGCEQLCRVLEAAVHHRCTQLNAPNRANSFGQMLNWLRERAIINERQYERWEAGRHLRNRASHAHQQSIYSPDMALGHVRITADLINELFQTT